ncbi:DsbA family protein [Chitinasiproducens palmae]|nr:DsbA family protein [Chitinasiproducens palmae]
MTTTVLHYVHDPLCGWCYAAAPLVEAARDRNIAVTLHGGGLWEFETRFTPQQRNVIRRSDERIAAIAGVPFGAAYLNGLLDDPTTVVWSPPPLAAVLAAGIVKSGAEQAMLRAVQAAHYVDGRRVVETTVLLDLAEQLGLAPAAFLHAFGSAPVAAHIAATREWMQAFGLRGFPGFVVERAGRFARLAHEPFYGACDAFLDAIDEIEAEGARLDAAGTPQTY